jgi:hypothetical protein
MSVESRFGESGENPIKRLLLQLEDSQNQYKLCRVSEYMNDLAIEEGMYITIRIDGVEGMIKFVGALSFLCTKHPDVKMIGNWYLPVRGKEEEHTYKWKIINSIIGSHDESLEDIFRDTIWTFSRKSSWTEIPVEVNTVVDTSPEGITLYKKDDITEIGEFLDWYVPISDKGHHMITNWKTSNS